MDATNATAIARNNMSFLLINSSLKAFTIIPQIKRKRTFTLLYYTIINNPASSLLVYIYMPYRLVAVDLGISKLSE